MWALAERREGNASLDGWLPRANDRGGTWTCGKEGSAPDLQPSFLASPNPLALPLQEELFTEKPRWLAPNYDFGSLVGARSPRVPFPS